MANAARAGVANAARAGVANAATNGAPTEVINGARADRDPVRERPTDMIPPVRDDAAEPLTSPISRAEADALRQARRPDPVDGGPATEAWAFDPDESDDESGPRREPGPGRGGDRDSGPATMVGSAPPGAEVWHRRRVAAAQPDTAAAIPTFDDVPAGLGGPDTALAGGEPDGDEGTSRGGRLAESAGQAWAIVIAQWIAGAVSGAVLWVAFRFLWRSLPVVALAAAVLVTAGLIVVVRALMRNDDTRTTVFAVLVGLLLTVSPAILALVGR